MVQVTSEIQSVNETDFKLYTLNYLLKGKHTTTQVSYHSMFLCDVSVYGLVLLSNR